MSINAKILRFKRQAGISLNFLVVSNFREPNSLGVNTPSRKLIYNFGSLNAAQLLDSSRIAEFWASVDAVLPQLVKDEKIKESDIKKVTDKYLEYIPRPKTRSKSKPSFAPQPIPKIDMDEMRKKYSIL
jgi:hypothetical protein